MNNILNLASILKDSNYSLSMFTEPEIERLESNIIPKEGKAYIKCIIRDREIQLKPEEIIRQLYTSKLINTYGYSKQRIKLEHPVSFGRETKSVDIVIFDKDRPLVEYIICRPSAKMGHEIGR
ncbi:type I restriction enzyme HsdR N-terminal domain-containing protein [Chloroflexota bacterium]